MSTTAEAVNHPAHYQSACPKCRSTELLSTENTAKFLEMALGSFRRWVYEGKITPACYLPPRRRMHFCPACVQKQHEAVQESSSQKQQTLLQEARLERLNGTRICRVCNIGKRLSEFVPSEGCKNGRSYKCKACATQYKHNKYSKDLRAKWARDFNNNNRDRRRRQCLESYHRTKAIEEGKTSSICKRAGFSLVQLPNGWYRAARLDRPIAAGEKAMAHYQIIAARWVVTAPPMATAEQLRVTKICQTREENKRKK